MKWNQFPIKYIENNLVLNYDGEWFAYYELIPYNYAFLSYEQKIQIQESFRQLVAQVRDGKMHVLQIASENSIRRIQEMSKKEVRGNLKELACDIIDQQTEALVDMAKSENIIDYRFFLGFKLMKSEQELNLKSIGESLKSIFTDFLYEVNHELMGDFISVNNDEIRRYQKLEKLLEDKISRRFKIRRAEEKDFGYLIEHIYGKTKVAYEEYEYYLPVVKLKKTTQVKKYDLIKPARCKIEESQRHLKFMSEKTECYAAYFTIEEITSDLEFPSSEILYYQQKFDFPVDVSINVEIVPNKKALTTVRNKKKELNDLDNHACNTGNETSENVMGALEDVTELEADLSKTKESMYKMSYIVRVSASDKEELQRRCDEVRDAYDDWDVKLVRPFGDMLGLHSEFIPGSRRYINDYVQYVTSDFLAGLGFGATQMLGETHGIYIGYNIETGQNVYILPWLPAQGVKGSVTNALAAAFLGSLGGGKSATNNLILYYTVLYGGKVIILDPKGERGKWKEDLPELADEINIVNITSDEKNQGLLDPYVIMENLKDAESLALDILTFLTGISSRDGKKFSVLRKAIRAVGKSEKKGLLLVIDKLREQKTDIAEEVADHIENFSDSGFAHLLFSDGAVEKSISFEKSMNIIQIADLVLPNEKIPLEEYTITEMLSISMLIAISTFSLNFIHSDRSIFKVVDLDEAWSLLKVAQGKALSNKLVRAGRAMNSGVYFVTQNTGDLQGENLKNNIGFKFAFRSTDINEIKQTLEFFGLDPEDENNQKALSELENGQCLFQDLYGRVGIVAIHRVFEHLVHAFDTRPPMQEVVT